jgi:hypothetical protein
MKAKLIKNHYGYAYLLADENGNTIATSDNSRLSLKNCDSLFGVKVFTLEDVILIAEYVRVASQSTPNERTKKLVDEYLSTQPTEIEVEIESKIAIDGHTILGYELDSEGCLILKK